MTEATTFDCHWQSVDIWVETTKNSLQLPLQCTDFSEIYKRSGILQARYTL
jgi:hypothetical protein